MGNKSKVVQLMEQEKNAEIQYQQQCQQAYEDALIDKAYEVQEKERAAKPDTPPEMIPAIIRYNEWYSLTGGANKITAMLNRIETMGFKIVHVVPGGMGGEYVVTGVRAVGKEISQKSVDSGEPEPLPEVDPASEPAVLGEANEEARREWEQSD
jgi:hypothetical protein